MHLLIHPGWQDSGPSHWQTHWQANLPHAQRVSQADWLQPELDDWVASLDTQIDATAGPVLLACHSLGCLNLVHWAQRYPHKAAKVAAALLVAPADVERADAPQAIRGFAPIPRKPLPFACTVVASDNDPFSQLATSRALAQVWGAELVVLKGAGHINSDAGFGPWPEGLALLGDLQARVAY